MARAKEATNGKANVMDNDANNMEAIEVTKNNQPCMIVSGSHD